MNAMLLVMTLSLVAGQDASDVRVDPGGVTDDLPKPRCNHEIFEKMKKAGDELMEAERERELALNFVNTVGQMLEEAHARELERALFRIRAEHKRCLEARQRPSMLCTALAARDVSKCDGIFTEAHRETCKLVLPAFRAVYFKKVEECDAYADENLRELCRSLLGEKISCENLSPPDFAAACKLVAARREGREDQPEAVATPEGQAYLSWMMAIVFQEAYWCDRLPSSAYSTACHAMFRGDAYPCPLVRPVVEQFDGDWSCRSVVAYQAVHELPSGQELVADLILPFKGTARCRWGVMVQEGEQVMIRHGGEVVLDGSGWGRQVRTVLPNAKVTGIQVVCTWDPGEGAYVLERPAGEEW